MHAHLRIPLSLLREPLFRLLAVNLMIGVAAAALMLGGLLALNLHGLRDLIAADSSPLTALGLLLFGFVVTFGSVAMGTAVMAIGRGEGTGGNRKSVPLPAAVRAQSRQ
jgi:hypothetical protein